jgi:hypothetical protein
VTEVDVRTISHDKRGDVNVIPTTEDNLTGVQCASILIESIVNPYEFVRSPGVEVCVPLGVALVSAEFSSMFHSYC